MSAAYAQVRPGGVVPIFSPSCVLPNVALQRTSASRIAWAAPALLFGASQLSFGVGWNSPDKVDTTISPGIFGQEVSDEEEGPTGVHPGVQVGGGAPL